MQSISSTQPPHVGSSAKEIAEKAIGHLQTTPFDKSEFEREYQRLRPRLRCGGQPDLTRMIKIVGRTFFGGALQGVHFDWDDSLRNPQDSRGIRFGQSDWPQYGRPQIRIRVLPRWQEKDYIDLDEKIVGTLLHECVHAYIMEGACAGRCNDGYQTKGHCHLLFCLQAGIYGHGDAFHKIAAELENKINGLSIFRADLGRLNAAHAHLRDDNKKVSNEVLESCFPGIQVYT